MHKPLLGLIPCVVPCLIGCSPDQPPPDVDPALGRACFAAKQAELPPGSQYEGIAAAADGKLSIKVMNGVGVVSVDCVIGPDGQVR